MRKTIFSLVLASALIAGPAIAAPDWVLPNSAATPGSTNPNVTQNNIQATICKSGFTNTIRPSITYTNKLKKTELAGSYKSFTTIWGTNLANYELDHLISLQLGGNPSDVKNLWVEPYAANGARKKDVVETALKRLVCANKLSLVAAQTAISTDWVKAYNTYVTPADVKNASANG